LIPVSTFSGKRVAIFGLGGSGISTARALQEGGAEVLADDDNETSRERAAQTGIPTGALRDADWSGFDALVLAPGVPLTHPQPHWSVVLAGEHGVEIIGDIELFCRERRARCPDSAFIAITGTNGKSTTTALIGHIFAQAGRDPQVGGNIGTSILDLAPPTAASVHVVECSSYQIDLAPSLDPSVGIILNVTPDHIDRHGTLAHYAAVKERLVAASRTSIVGTDDAICSAIADRLDRSVRETGTPENVIRISAEHPVGRGIYLKGADLVREDQAGERVVAGLSGIGALRGTHNGQNAAAAFAACHAAGLRAEDIVAGLKSFPGLSHRMEVIGKIGHVLFVNDSKATNAEAAERSLASFDRMYWLAGGRMKEGGITSLVQYGPKIAKAYLFGESEREFERTLMGHCPVVVCGNLADAVKKSFEDAMADAAEEPVVLLAPACASFDQFANFELRGEAFRDAFRTLQDKALSQAGES